MPSKERLRADQERGPPSTREDPADRGHEQAVATTKLRPGDMALEDLQLMAEDHQLNLGVHLFVGRARDPPDYTAQQTDRREPRARTEPPGVRRPDGTNPRSRQRSEVCVPFTLLRTFPIRGQSSLCVHVRAKLAISRCRLSQLAPTAGRGTLSHVTAGEQICLPSALIRARSSS